MRWGGGWEVVGQVVNLTGYVDCICFPIPSKYILKIKRTKFNILQPQFDSWGGGGGGGGGGKGINLTS